MANTCSIRIGESPRLGSSSSSSFGRAISARPIISICCSPPDSVPACCLRTLAQAREIVIDALELGRLRCLRRWQPGAERQIVARRSCSGKISRPSGTCTMPRATMPVDRKAAEILALEPDAPAGQRHDAGDAVERRGLAGAVGAEQAHDLAGRDGERHVLERADLAVARRDGPRAQACAALPEIGLDHLRIAADLGSASPRRSSARN